MKIAIVSDAVYPYSIGGTEKRIYEISARLAKRGHKVTIYSMQWWEGADTRVDEGVKIKAISPYFPLYSGKKRSIKEALLFSLHCLKLVKEDFDIIDVNHMPHLVLFSTKLVALLKRKKLHVIWNEVWGASYWIKYMGLSGVLAAWIEKITSMLPDKFTAVSEHTAIALMTELKVPRHKIIVIPNGISTAELEDIVPATSSSDVIFIGRLLSHKNVDVLIQSIALLKTNHPRIKCIIVGRGPERDNLIKLVQKNDLLENIEFIGCIEDHHQLYALMKSSRVFAFPSTREGFGIVVLEANGCGLPVITTDHPQNAARHLIKEGLNGKTISLSKENLANAIDLFMTMKRDLTGYNSFLQRYDWNHLTQRVEDIYTTQWLSKTISKEELTPLEANVDAQEMYSREEVLVDNSKAARGAGSLRHFSARLEGVFRRFMKRIHRNSISNLPTKKHPSTPMKAKNHAEQLFKLVLLLLGVTLIVGMLIFFNLNRASIYNDLATLDLIPKPEKLTELYFNDSANLPDSATSNQVVNFAFVIHNLETTDYQYIYQVSVIANGTRHIVNSGKVLIKNNQYYVKNEQIKLLSSPGSQEVVVELTNKQQSIDFWTRR